MSNIPAQVLRNAAEADRLAKEEETRRHGRPEPEGEQPEADAEDQQEVQEVEVQPPPPPPPPPQEAAWEQKYKTLQGKYNSEVPRLTADVKRLQDSLEQALSELEALKRAPAKVTAPPQNLVTPKDVEAFGGDLIDLIKRQAQEIVSAREVELDDKLKVIEAENAKLRKQLTGVTEQQGQTAQQAFISQLAQKVPDWEAINVDQGFLEWLAGVDEFSGQTRQTYLDLAVNKFDVTRTAHIFQSWKNMQAAIASRQSTDTRKSELQRQVTPGKSRSVTQQVADPSKKIWSQAEIEGFYKDLRAGAYRGKDEEARRIEAEIDLAVATGRIQK